MDTTTINTTLINNNLDKLLNKFTSADKFLNSFNGGRRQNIETETSSTSTEDLDTLNLSNLVGGKNMDEKEYLNKQIEDLIDMKNKILGGNYSEEEEDKDKDEKDEYEFEQYSKMSNQVGGINQDIDKINLNQYGGKKKKSLYELNRKVDDLHEKALNDIKELMKCSDDEAAVYKSVVYRKVKAENPDLGGVDRAQKMFDYINKKFLKDVDLQAEIDKRLKEQEENANKPKKENKKSSKKSSKKSKKSNKSDKKSNKSDEIDI